MLVIVIVLLIMILLSTVTETFKNGLIPFTSGGWGGSRDSNDNPYESVTNYKSRLSKWVSKEPMFNKEYHISHMNRTHPTIL